MPGPSSPPVGPPDLALAATALADVELALLGLLPDGQLLGGPVGSADASSGPATTVLVQLSAAEADAVLTAGAAVLRDEEHTPLAELSGVTEQSRDGDQVFLRAVVTRRRTRESGAGARHALTAADLDPTATASRRSLLVVARPVVESDGPALAALDSSGDDVVVVVPTGGGSPGGEVDAGRAIPASVLLQVARELSEHGPLVERSELRTAPLSWRDPVSDTVLVDRLAAALGARTTVHLRPDGDDGASRQWRDVRLALDRGAPVPIAGVTAETESALRRWRPPRAQRGVVVMFTGLSGSGKSTLARDVSTQIVEQTTRTLSLLDGDVVRTMLSSGLGFDRASRILNVRRIGYVGAEIARHGGIAICAPIAPYASTRSEVRAMAEQVGDFVLVHVSTPLEVCEARDLKGLYAKARAGLIPEFTGISDPYDVPTDADLSIDTSTMTREAAVAQVFDHLTADGWLSKEAP